MPGLSLVFSKDALMSSHLKQFRDNKNLQNREITNCDDHFLKFDFYNGYPSFDFSIDEIDVFIEGRIYNYSYQDIKTNILNIVRDFRNTKNLTKLQSWIKKCDGEFLIYIYLNESKELLIFNDSLGRLPIYYNKTEFKLILSRSLEFVLKNSKTIKYNDLSLSQFLLFGYTLDDRTLFNDIFRLNPASIFYINPKGEINLIEDSYLLNYEQKVEIKENSKLYTSDLTELFIAGCKSRTLDNKNVLSLSGGLDSRIVAGGLHKAGAIFNTTTLLDPWKVNSQEGILEVDLAKEISELLKVDNNIYEGFLGRGSDFYKMLNIKDGTNHLGFSYLLRYLDAVLADFGSNIQFFTGDGGDKVVKYQLPSMKIGSYNSLVDYILKVHKRFDLQKVSQITKISESDLKDSLVERLKSYPEVDLNFKYVRFVFQERVKNWLFEGEDRNRNYFWSVTPFYSTDFFLASMQMPDKLKKKNKLYIDMLNYLHPKLNKVIYANLKWPVDSIKSKIYLTLKDYYNHLPSNYRAKLRKVANKETIVSHKDNITLRLLKEQVTNSIDFYSEYFHIEEIMDFEKLNSDELKMLFNLTSTMEHHSLNKSIFKQNLNTTFPFK